jgi:UV DNA damage endonuclease
MLVFNRDHSMLFFRISSDLIPFASHPVCDYPWQTLHQSKFREIGDYIQRHRMRISMHPDQFTLINSIREDVFHRSVGELEYHARVLDLLGLDLSAKIQIHVGGVYNDHRSSLNRFIHRYQLLDIPVKRRLVIENDERLYSLRDCLEIHKSAGVPVLFDSFHHSLNNRGEDVISSLKECRKTWIRQDGIPMVDYSSPRPDSRPGSHAETIDGDDFGKFISISRPLDFDVMLEIKDKEKSALKAVEWLRSDPRFLES